MLKNKRKIGILLKKANCSFFSSKNIKCGGMKMEKDDAINYLEKLKEGDFLTVNIPIVGHDIVQVTAMYIGKEKDGSYKFMDTGNFQLSKEFLERGKVTIDKEFNGYEAIEIHEKFKRLQEKCQMKNRMIR